jgi:hypothetical protein
LFSYYFCSLSKHFESSTYWQVAGDAVLVCVDKQLIMASTKLNQQLIKEFAKLGATVENYGTRRGPLHGIEMTCNDTAYRAFVNHCLPNGLEDVKAIDDPLVLVVPTPFNTGIMTPQLTQVANILTEAAAIITAYQNLLANNFEADQHLPYIIRKEILSWNVSIRKFRNYFGHD